MRYHKVEGSWANFLYGLKKIPHWAQIEFESGDFTIGRVRSRFLRPGFLLLSVAVNCGDEALASSEFCDALSGEVGHAARNIEIGFGRIDFGNFTEYTNMDVALRRKLALSLEKSHEILRGYAWAILCPREIVANLGGMSRIANSGAFYRVTGLRSGGALLQASATAAAYSEESMGRIYEFLAPVLPGGFPRSDPAFPDVQFVEADPDLLGREWGSSGY